MSKRSPKVFADSIDREPTATATPLSVYWRSLANVRAMPPVLMIPQRNGSVMSSSQSLGLGTACRTRHEATDLTRFHCDVWRPP